MRLKARLLLLLLGALFILPSCPPRPHRFRPHRPPGLPHTPHPPGVPHPPGLP